MVTEAFISLLVSLATDPIQASEFRSDPDSILAQLQLTDYEKTMIKQGDAASIQKAIAGDDASYACHTEKKYQRPLDI